MLVAVSLPVLIGFAGLVLDVGNWFEHKRHLQVQADAGALAAGSRFRIPCADAPILASAAEYSGIHHNEQVGGTPAAEIHREFNSATWFDQPSIIDDTVVTGSPCAAKMIDVKLTETDLPWFLKLAQVPFINAQARVEIRKKERVNGALPIGVPDVDPQLARAIFVDETTTPPTQIAQTPLVRGENADGLSIWSNVDAPVSVGINSSRIGVRIVLGGGTSTTCGQPLVECYDAGSANGLVRIRGWSGAPAGTATAPQARSVELIDGSCQNGYFMAAGPDPDPCTIGVRATVDFGSAPVATSRLTATRSGSNTDYPLSFDSATGRWSSTETIPIEAGDGPVNITLDWETGCPTNGNGNCDEDGSFGVVQRSFGGSDDRSGPLKLIRVSEASVPGANSFPRCAAPGCTHDLVVTIGLQGDLSAAAPGDPPVSLKLAGGGSLNQALDCDDGAGFTNLKDELAKGCTPSYEPNTGTACPGKAALWATPQPPAWQCVAVKPGEQANQVPAGMNLRVYGDEAPDDCTAPNNWPNWSQGDPRIVQVFLTPFGAFAGAGADSTVPVTGFATFYATGWAGQGGGFANPCEGEGDDTAGPGAIVGHFINYIDTLNNGGASEELCDFDALAPCVAVLTK